HPHDQEQARSHQIGDLLKGRDGVDALGSYLETPVDPFFPCHLHGYTLSSSCFCFPKIPEGLMRRVTMMARRATTMRKWEETKVSVRIWANPMMNEAIMVPPQLPRPPMTQTATAKMSTLYPCSTTILPRGNTRMAAKPARPEPRAREMMAVVSESMPSIMAALSSCAIPRRARPILLNLVKRKRRTKMRTPDPTM